MSIKKAVLFEERGDLFDETIRDLLVHVGEDPQREGLLKTPRRVADSLRYLCGGYDQDLDEIVNGAVFHEESEGLVMVRDIQFYSLCEHHLLPFFGTAHVAYMPKGRILGLSKLARIVDMYARRLQVQERLTTEVGQAVESVLAPAGVAVTMQANHLCMAMRGVEKPGATTMTTFRSGVFRETDRWDEFQGLVRG